MAAPIITQFLAGTGSLIGYPPLSPGDTLVICVGEYGTSASKYLLAPTVGDHNGRVFTQLSALGGGLDGVASALFHRVIDGSEASGAAISDPYASGTSTFQWLRFVIPSIAGSPVDAVAAQNVLSTAFTWPSVTTIRADALVCLFGIAGAPVPALDTAGVAGFTRVGGVRSGSTLGMALYSAVQAAPGATGVKTSDAAIAANGFLDQHAVAFGGLSSLRASAFCMI